MKINVHIKEKTFGVSCGTGEQRIIWLGHVAIARYDSNYGLELGVPKGIKTDEGEVLDENMQIKDVLEDGQHVWVLLKGFEINPIRTNSKQ
ncbi:hypothetical protein ABK040_006771 [Willaertia magna]